LHAGTEVIIYIKGISIARSMEESFTVSDIGEVARLSREREGLCRLKSPSFYADAQRLICDLERQLLECEQGSREARMLSDQLRTARRQLKQLFRNRMARIVWLAVMGATSEWEGLASEVECMTEQEREVYQEVLAIIVRARQQLLDAQQTPSSSDSASHPEPEGVQPELFPSSKSDINEKYVVVRALEAVPTFLGSDGRIYTLGREDVATVPTPNAKVLINRGLAVAIHAEGYSISTPEGESR